MATAVPAVTPVSDLIDAGGFFADAAAAHPLSAVLIALGGLLILFSMAVFGYLTLGAVVDLIIPEQPGRAPPRRE